MPLTCDKVNSCAIEGVRVARAYVRVGPCAEGTILESPHHQGKVSLRGEVYISASRPHIPDCGSSPSACFAAPGVVFGAARPVLGAGLRGVKVHHRSRFNEHPPGGPPLAGASASVGEGTYTSAGEQCFQRHCGGRWSTAPFLPGVYIVPGQVQLCRVQLLSHQGEQPRQGGSVVGVFDIFTQQPRPGLPWLSASTPQWGAGPLFGEVYIVPSQGHGAIL
jgi:hypothetical protein